MTISILQFSLSAFYTQRR